MKESSAHCNKGKIDLPKTARKIFNTDMGVNGVIKGFTEEAAVDQVSEGIVEDTNGMENMEFILGKSALTRKIFNKEMGVNGALEGFVVDKARGGQNPPDPTNPIHPAPKIADFQVYLSGTG
jgi:hypothetical protein